jgi:hypothetical protein
MKTAGICDGSDLAADWRTVAHGIVTDELRDLKCRPHVVASHGDFKMFQEIASQERWLSVATRQEAG